MCRSRRSYLEFRLLRSLENGALILLNLNILFMPFDEKLADRVREIFADQSNVEEKRMFGGLCFMLNEKMCVCVRQDEIMCRFDPETYQPLLEKPGVRQMVHGNRVMKGYVYVEADSIRTSRELLYWINLALKYNETAKVSLKRSKS